MRGRLRGVLAHARAAATLIAAGAVIGVAVLGGAGASAASATSGVAVAPVQAADLSQFRAGNIISDAVFFDRGTMTEGQIQQFLEQKVPRCQSGYTCLRDKWDTTRSTTADAMCGAYSGGGSERASTIIYKVAQACGINPRVIIATLEKEQSLVTHTWPSDYRFRAAMGQGCPDTAACDTRYYGFFNQVYGAAWQFKRYANPPGTSHYFTWYAPGRTWNVLFNPNHSCGSSPVFIQNQATANLYYYTPYQPNAASLRAGYGEGDGCSSYGNRNFFQFFTDWFGSTITSAGSSAIAARHESSGGDSGWLGPAVGNVTCGLVEGGCYQDFRGGKVHWSPNSGAHATRGSILGAWQRNGWESGGLGYPTSEETCGIPDNGCYQEFQKGKIYWTAATDARSVKAPILAGWAAIGYERGALGYPVQEANCGLPGGGCYQDFQFGKVYWTATTGARAVIDGPVLDSWATRGYERGALGYPTGPQGCGLPNGGCYQDFQGGKLYWSQGSGAHVVKGGILGAWGRTGYERGSLGYPVAEEECALAGGGCRQDFAGGTLFWSAPTDANLVRGAILTEYLRLGGPSSKLGYPLAAEGCGLPGGGCYQEFQGGKLYWSSATGAHATWGGIQQKWAAQGYERGPLGYPTGNEECGLAQGGCSQKFQFGTYYWSAPTDARTVVGAILTKYVAQGGPSGSLGYPTGEQQCSQGGACTQRFQNGTLTG